YETPSIADLQCLLLTNRQPFGPVTTHFGSMALDKGLLTDLGITHVVNYMSISYCGVEASDHPQFDLSQYFCSTASFIKAALTQNGKVLVHGNLTITDAIIAVRLNRDICPNSGFLEHLRDLGNQLKR
uniref:Si:dkey-24f15.2 n=1 Tax=Cyprinus carpio TaxID=7962 RepID=A0A8C1YHK5_CYPCA